MEKWQMKADEFAAFIAEHGRAPERRSANARERKLHIWMLNQRAARAGRSTSTWSPQRQTYLDRLLPGWDRNRHDTWHQHATGLATFVTAHGRLPQQRATDTQELRLWYWLRRQRDSKIGCTASWTTEREEYLGRHVPGWTNDTT